MRPRPIHSIQTAPLGKRRTRTSQMKIEARVFLLIAVFCWVIAGVYGYWSNETDGHVEVAGLAALILSGGLLGISGSFFWFVSRRIDPRPEDRPDAEI